VRGSSDHQRCNGDGPWQGSALPASCSLLAQYSIRVSPKLHERLRVAASQLGLCQREIAAAAIDRFVPEDGF